MTNPTGVKGDAVSREGVKQLFLTIQAARKLGEDVATELRTKGKVVHTKADFLTALKKLPSVLPDSQLRLRAEAAIEWFSKEVNHWSSHHLKQINYTPEEVADLLRWLIGQEQDTWDGKRDFGLEEK